MAKWRCAVVICFFPLLGCSKVKTESTVFPKITPECEGQAHKTRHVARWVDGHVTLINGPKESELRAGFVAKNLAQLELVEPDYVIAQPNSGVVVPQAETADNWDVKRIRADHAWRLSARGGGITVAVIDTGADILHEQLRNRIAINSGEVPDNGVDDDANGLIDDYAGFDFAAHHKLLGDYAAHGTHVSGIIAAEHFDNVAGERIYVQGVAPEAKILPLAFIDDSGGGSLFGAMEAIDYAVSRGAKVINASWGGAGCSVIFRDQIAGLFEKNVIFVAAAGNSGIDIDRWPEYPAAYNLLAQLTVGATGVFNARANFSNYGDLGVHLFAPGVDIVSTVPGDKMGMMSGTSMATPLVSGSVAVLLAAKPTLTAPELRALLYASAARDVTYRNASNGRIDLGAALAALLQ